MWLISLTCGLIKCNSYSSSPLTWVEPQVLNSVATMWLIGLDYERQSLPRQTEQAAKGFFAQSRIRRKGILRVSLTID